MRRLINIALKIVMGFYSNHSIEYLTKGIKQVNFIRGDKSLSHYQMHNKEEEKKGNPSRCYKIIKSHLTTDDF